MINEKSNVYLHDICILMVIEEDGVVIFFMLNILITGFWCIKSISQGL